MSCRVAGRVVEGLRQTSRPLFVCALLSVVAGPVFAQDPVRPWLDWRTIATPHYRFHYLPEIETWARDVAERIESVDSAVTRLVGYSAPKPMHVVVDDPFIVSNGYALPFLDKPVAVFWATPADPRNDIGNYRTWGELLSVHEITHIAHLGRPSRNWWQRSLWSSLPANLGPIALKAPRWLYEGYATFVEGRITGTGRPNNAWRPAILRQWAIDGHLPTYGQLAMWDDFNGGEFAYLGGSAFLEWLTQRDELGDSSLVHVWRRLTAKRVRSFESAFAGVFGDSPSLLYGRHTAELTRDAMKAKARLERAGLVAGELVQRLSWATGDPAISPNGERVAVVLREKDRPGRVVIWNTAPEAEDTAAIRKRLDAMKRDPEDVPDRRFYPRTKAARKTLLASNGRSYQMPRWYADNRRVLLTRWTQRDDASLSPALYEWDTENGAVRRITNPVGVLHADPHPNSRDAVAMQCHWGHCDIVHVDLESGIMRTLFEGAPDRTYYRPRYSPDGSWFAASVVDEGRWKVVLSSTDGKHVRFVDPEDGANRYDVQWLDRDRLVVVSDRGGIPNLETISVADVKPRTLTRVTGATVGPDVNRVDGSIWFLSLHSRGFDVRRLPRDSAIADSAILITADAFGFAGVRQSRPVELPASPVAPPTPYGAAGGPRHQRWFPGGYASADGAGALLSIYNGDIVGRLNATLTAAYGQRGAWQGGSLRAIWRYPRPHLELGAHGFVHEPSFARRGQAAADSVDGSLVQGLLALSRERMGESWRGRVRVGGGWGTLSPRNAERHRRTLAFGEAQLQWHQMRGAGGLVERLRVHADFGETRDEYHRVIAAFEIATTGRDALPIALSVTVGGLVGHPHPFEQFTLGGSASPVMDSSLLSQRYSAPWLPTALAAGNSLLAWRAAIPGFWTLFFESASATNDLYKPDWNRAVGIETRFSFPNMPVAFIPRVEARGGLAYTLDQPVRKKLRGFLEIQFHP